MRLGACEGTSQMGLASWTQAVRRDAGGANSLTRCRGGHELVGLGVVGASVLVRRRGPWVQVVWLDAWT